MEGRYLKVLRQGREPTAQDLLASDGEGEAAKAEAEATVKRLAKGRARLQAMLAGDRGIEQRTPPWYAARDELLTASDTAQALGLGKFGTKLDLLRKKVTRAPQVEPGPNDFNPFIHGQVYEPVALQVYRQARDGVEVYDFGLLRHPTLRCFGCSPDGVSELGIMLEIKCPVRRKINGEIAEQYMIQMQGQMEVADLDECDFVEVEIDSYPTLANMCKDMSRPWNQRGAVLSDADDKERIYSPPGADEAGLRAWLAENGRDPDDGWARDGLRLWGLRKMLIQRVHRDPAFWPETAPRVQAFWDEVEAARVKFAAGEQWEPPKKARRAPTKRAVVDTTAVFPEDLFGGV